jgi:hypothetical protein
MGQYHRKPYNVENEVARLWYSNSGIKDTTLPFAKPLLDAAGGRKG